jgi:hypothetical protein
LSSEDLEAEKNEFAWRCMRLTKQLVMAVEIEESSRVWVSVLTQMIRSLARKEDNYDECIDAAVQILKRKDS